MISVRRSVLNSDMFGRALARVCGILAIMTLQACANFTRETPVPDDPKYAPVPVEQLDVGQAISGAIYQPARNFSFYGDRVAFNVGDILTVVLEEQTSATKSADTSLGKDEEIDFNEATILGNAIGFKGSSLLTNPAFEREFDGTASSDQSNSLSGRISVTVSSVLPNGVLKVQGEKWLKLNQGDEYIRLTGMVRVQDIGTDNTVQSSRIADARIAYGGTGAFDDANRQGWLGRFFNSQWWPL